VRTEPPTKFLGLGVRGLTCGFLACAVTAGVQAQALGTRVQIDNVRFEVVDLRPDDGVDASAAYLAGSGGSAMISRTYTYNPAQRLSGGAEGFGLSTPQTFYYSNVETAMLPKTDRVAALGNGLGQIAFLSNGNVTVDNTVTPQAATTALLESSNKTKRYLEVDALVTNNASVWLQPGQPNVSLAPGTQLTVSLDMRIDAFMDPTGIDLATLSRLGGAQLEVQALATVYGGGNGLETQVLGGGAGPSYLAYNDLRWLYPDGTLSAGTSTRPAVQTLSTFLTLSNLSDQTLTGTISIRGQSITRLIPTIPEPGTWATFALGLAGLTWAVRRRKLLQA
jgi:PEP-CTERM motif